MTPLTIASTLLSLVQSSSSSSTSSTASTSQTNTAGSSNTDFSSALTLRMAALQAQSVTSLLNVTNGQSAASTSTGLDWLTGASSSSSAANDPLAQLGSSSATTGLSASGYNMSLFDPQSAYKMMSVINTKDVSYKAQFSELSEMQTAVSSLQDAGQTLGSVSDAMDGEAIKSQLQTFAAKYNEWITRFDGTVKDGGVLAGTQAAEVSLYELEQSVENPFNGAKDGLHGLSDLGFSIDESTNLASLDTTRFDAALASNKGGAVNTLQEFAVNFAKSAELLNSPNNFIPNRLDNLDRVIDYVADHKSSLQAEFGLGDAAQPSAQIAKALAAYNKTFGS